MTFTQYIHVHLHYLNFLANAWLAWIVCNYTYASGPLTADKGLSQPIPRFWFWLLSGQSLCLGAWIYIVSGHSILIGAYVIVLGLGFRTLRSKVPTKFLAEAEVVGNLFYGASLPTLAHLLRLPLEFKIVGKFDPAHVSAVMLITSIVIYVEVGGTNIVRGLLEKGRILPELEDAAPKGESLHAPASNDSIKDEESKKLDQLEYQHGRLIGNAERLLLLSLVAIQAYQALAFLMTAKGLFRAKELESRSFSEYFLVGTLVSSGIAVAAGLLIQLVISLCW